MTTIQIPEGLILKSGGHASYADGACLMEAVAYIAGEKHTDQPKCVSPVLGAFGRRLNDAMTDTERQQLVPLIPKLIGTANDGLDERRAYIAADWYVRDYLSRLLERLGRPTMAESLRLGQKIVDAESADNNRRHARAIRKEILEDSKRAEFVDWLKAEIAKTAWAAAADAAYAAADADAYAAYAAAADAAAYAAYAAYAAADAADAAADAADAAADAAYAAAYAADAAYAARSEIAQLVAGSGSSDQFLTAFRAWAKAYWRARLGGFREQIMAELPAVFEALIDGVNLP